MSDIEKISTDLKRREVTIETPPRPGEDYGEASTLWVTEVGPNRFRLLESNSFVFSDYLLLWGDEIIVAPSTDGTYRLVEVVAPSAMAHIFSIGGSPQGATGFTNVLHELGGEWECDMGGLTMVHVPHDNREELIRVTGVGKGGLTLSGFQDYGDEEDSATEKEETLMPLIEARSAKEFIPPDLSKPHVVLLGDSIFDNAPYVAGGPAVIDHLQSALTPPWRATLLAHDGDIAANVSGQLERLPKDATHLVVSVGGNDALMAQDALNAPARSVMSALGHLHEIRRRFQRAYRAMLWEVLDQGLPVAVCTIYDAVPGLSEELQTALSLFNDTITREAAVAGVPVIDLRAVCTEREDYSELSPIEPSVTGGAKISAAICRYLNFEFETDSAADQT